MITLLCLLHLNLVLVEHGKYITGGSLEDNKCVPNNALGANKSKMSKLPMFSHKELQLLNLSEYHKVPTCALFLVVPLLPAVFREDILRSETKGA